MKTKIPTILAVVLFVAALSTYGTNAKRARHSSTAPSLPSNGVMTTAAVPQSNFEGNHGKIKRIYPDTTGVYFRFGGNPGEFQTAMNPANGYYFIPMTHPNYQALRELLYVAAVNRLNLQARTQPTLIGGYAHVIYLVQDF